MMLTETARLQLEREFVDVYGLVGVVEALRTIAMHKADACYNAANELYRTKQFDDMRAVRSNALRYNEAANTLSLPVEGI